jgi:hypothetical protein
MSKSHIQELYEKMSLHLLAMTAQSAVNGTCLYRRKTRSKNYCNTRCIVGSIILDSEYLPEMDYDDSLGGTGSNVLLELYVNKISTIKKLVRNSGKQRAKHFSSMMQNIHDENNTWEGSKKQIREFKLKWLRDVGKQFKLDTSFLGKF